MVGKTYGKIMAFLLAVILTVSMIPSAIITNAAPINLALQITYKEDIHRYELSYAAIPQPAKTVISWHEPDGSLYETTQAGSYEAGTVKFYFDFLPDHIYDITAEAYVNMDDVAPYAAGSTYYLADITFTGESFNVMAKMSDIEDMYPELDDLPGQAVSAQSGNHPKMRLKWKVPTIYNTATGTVESVTSLNPARNQFLTLLSQPDAAIATVGFQISMRKGKASPVLLNFNTTYDDLVAGDDLDADVVKDMILEGTAKEITGIENGDVTSADGFVTLVLDETNGIEPGTEYEMTDIGIIFKNTAGEQIPVRRTHLETGQNNHFPVSNIDNAFSDYGGNLTSIYTPMQFEISKVDVDKVQVIFKRIVNGVYPELFYQVQYAPRIDDLYTQTQSWVKIPGTTLTGDYGSEIIEIPVSGTSNPEYYFRVVFFDSSSGDPISSSLCLNLQLLGIDSGKPPLPREIAADPIYAGRDTVTVPDTDVGGGDVEIPRSDLRLSFEKPLNWKLIPDWTAYRNSDYAPEDFTFHIILSTYLPGVSSSPETREIGLGQTEWIYMPVKQKRVLVIGKKDLIEDPNDPDRLVCTIPGDRLFWDYTANNGAGAPITNENNEDPSEDGVAGDYPGFLVPNTTYYMQIFTSRYEHNDEIYADLWGDAAGLAAGIRENLSFVSPIISFTTWPLNELPVPVPNVRPENNVAVDPATGGIVFNGITVNYQRIMTETEWNRYTIVIDGREIVYEFYISQDASDEGSFALAATSSAQYPADSNIINRSVQIVNDGDGNPLKANTVYYIKARASLYAGLPPTHDLIGRSVYTPVKAITTPKIDSGSLDNITRDPRAPAEFNIAVDADGEQLLSDAWVDFSWVHAENDVAYEMICTSLDIPHDAGEDAYADDTDNAAFLEAYSEFLAAPGDKAVTIDPDDPGLSSIGFTLDNNGKITLPIRRPLLRANRTYFFSLRAVRYQVDADGNTVKTVSRWVTIPVTTKLVQKPEYLEAVRDLEIGFNVICAQPGSSADTMELFMKKKTEPDSSYQKLLRSQYSAVKDGNTYYFRIYNLEPNLWYDIKLHNKAGDIWYNNTTGTWGASAVPVEAKTRDTLHEIEVRWVGEETYTYCLEALDENDVDYETLSYSATGFTDYGYDLPNGTRIMFYKEKTNLFVDQHSPKYIYYAKISGKPDRKADGTIMDEPLKTNMTYSVKLWAVNHGDESLHIGPVTVRTDFSQKDYDEQNKRDNVADVFNMKAEELTRKLYWVIDKNSASTVRALVKGDMVSGLLQASAGETVTIDFSGELADPAAYEILIPQKVLETIAASDSRLNLRLRGAEITLNRGSIDLETLKRQSLANGAKEAMLRLRIDRKGSAVKPLPSGYKLVSKDYTLGVSGVGSRRTYAELNSMIYEILNDPDAKGPFKYGLFDRELTKVLQQAEYYSYRSHTDLLDMISGMIGAIETEMSRYLKDIIDGGSGLASNTAVSKPVSSFPGGIGVKIEYRNEPGLITPYVNYGGAGWKECPGAKGYYLSYVLFRVTEPGEYAVVASGAVMVNPGGAYGSAVEKLGAKYDLSKAFGKGTLYTANPITGQQAVMLYAVITGRDSEMVGLTPAQRAAALGIGDIVGARELNGYMDNQRSVSLVVKLYCEKAGIPAAMMKPSRTIIITNASQINNRLYQYVVLGIDLGFTRTEGNRFDATGRSSVGQILDMMSKALEMLGEI
jgi:hypothetical protein